MVSVRTSILGRPRRLSWDRRARLTYTLNCEEPYNAALPEDFPKPAELVGTILGGSAQRVGRPAVEHAPLLEVFQR